MPCIKYCKTIFYSRICISWRKYSLLISKTFPWASQSLFVDTRRLLPAPSSTYTTLQSCQNIEGRGQGGHSLKPSSVKPRFWDAAASLSKCRKITTAPAASTTKRDLVRKYTMKVLEAFCFSQNNCKGYPNCDWIFNAESLHFT